MIKRCIIVLKVENNETYLHNSLRNLLEEQIPITKIYVFVSRSLYPNGELSNRDAENIIESNKKITKIMYNSGNFAENLIETCQNHTTNIIYYPVEQDYVSSNPVETLYDLYQDSLTSGRNIALSEVSLNTNLEQITRPSVGFASNLIVSSNGITIFPSSILEESNNDIIQDINDTNVDLQLTSILWSSKTPILARGDKTKRLYIKDTYERDNEWHTTLNLLLQKTTMDSTKKQKNVRRTRQRKDPVLQSAFKKENQDLSLQQGPSVRFGSAPPQEQQRNTPVSTPGRKRVYPRRNPSASKNSAENTLTEEGYADVARSESVSKRSSVQIPEQPVVRKQRRRRHFTKEKQGYVSSAQSLRSPQENKETHNEDTDLSFTETQHTFDEPDNIVFNVGNDNPETTEGGPKVLAEAKGLLTTEETTNEPVKELQNTIDEIEHDVFKEEPTEDVVDEDNYIV